MLGLIASARSLVQERLDTLARLSTVLRAPLWATFVPAATFYVIGKSLGLETQLYLAREQAEKELRGHLATLAEAERQAAALGDAVGNPADLMLLIQNINEAAALVVDLERAVGTAQTSADRDLAQVAELPAAPLKILERASFFAKWGVWLALGVLAVVLYYAWRAGGLKAGAKKAAAAAAEVVK